MLPTCRSASRRRRKTGVYVMTMKTFFTILAVLALIHGIGFVLAPEVVAAS